ncbi:uncharacterized protein [Lolium perenne]|uniref:uncharacterized protein n=1 Tax=Lolium perenne TaxID=4522 RepID=UPI003A99134A
MSSSSSSSSDGVEGDFIAAFQEEYEEEMQAEEVVPRRRRRREFIRRDRLGAHDRLFEDYFADDCNYPPSYFRRRYRMRRSLFLTIVARLGEYSPYFTQRNDALNRAGFSPLQKCTAALRLLAYGAAADTIDEWLKLARKTSSDCLDRFCEGIIECYGETFCRRPTVEDTQRLLAKAEERGFPGMLGSIDCMHWQWRNCPVAHAGQFTRGDIKHPTIILEAVASYDRWIWHAFFGVAGSNNDLNVLNQSPLFTDVLRGVFTSAQSAHRKDVECAFGVLKARFNILAVPGRSYYRRTLGLIMRACVILHNMIIDDERG